MPWGVLETVCTNQLDLIKSLTTLVRSHLAEPPNIVVIYITLTESAKTICLSRHLRLQKSHELAIVIPTFAELKSFSLGQLQKV